MTTADFNKWYAKAASCNIEDSDLFNCAAFFWVNLTDKQLAFQPISCIRVQPVCVTGYRLCTPYITKK